MKFIYPFLVAMLGIVTFATGQNHPINKDTSLAVFFNSLTPIMPEGNNCIIIFNDLRLNYAKSKTHYN